MTHTYQVTGMTCSGCENKVKESLINIPEITAVNVSKESNMASVTTDKHVGLDVLQIALGVVLPTRGQMAGSKDFLLPCRQLATL